MPNLIVVSGGYTVGGLKELKQTTVSSTSRECVLITGLTEVGVAVGVVWMVIGTRPHWGGCGHMPY